MFRCYLLFEWYKSRKGYPDCDFVRWLGHQSLCRYQVPESERHQCCCWVGVHGLLSLVALTFTLYSAFAVGVVANIYGRFFRGNAFAVMVCPSGPPSSACRRVEPIQLDHGYIISTAVRPRQWWPSTFCIPTGLWQLDFDFVLEWIPGRLAVDLSVHWADRRTRYLSCTCFPSPVA